jgi:hypothetical protein
MGRVAVKRAWAKEEDMRTLQWALTQVPPGPRIEMGVLRGKRLKLIAAHDDVTYGVDSFEGMAEPSVDDYEPGKRKSQYPKGKLAAAIDIAAAAVPNATLIKGFVPEVLERVPNGPYAFAHLDMDQYRPTWSALWWLFAERMLPGGIVLCHDWFEDRTYLAGGAINDFSKAFPRAGARGSSAWWVV